MSVRKKIFSTELDISRIKLSTAKGIYFFEVESDSIVHVDVESIEGHNELLIYPFSVK